MVDVATKVMLGKSLGSRDIKSGLNPARNLVAIKAPVFSMSKLTGVDTYLGPEMKSTGEVMGIDHNFEAALGKALLAAGLMLPPEGQPAAQHRRPRQGGGIAYYPPLAGRATASMPPRARRP